MPCYRGAHFEKIVDDLTLTAAIFIAYFAMLSLVPRVPPQTSDHRPAAYLKTLMTFVTALFNLPLALNCLLEPETTLDDRLLYIAPYSP